MACPICGAKCVCRKRGEDGRCCSCHKHKTRTPAQASAHQEHDRKRRDATARYPIEELIGELQPQRVDRRDGFSYPGLFDRRVITDLLIINDGPVRVVIATERGDNPGASITNTIEKLAAALAREMGWLPERDFVLVEHYPAHRRHEALARRPYHRYGDDLGRSLDRVEFASVLPTGTWSQTGALISGPKWTHLGIEGLKALIAPAAVPA